MSKADVALSVKWARLYCAVGQEFIVNAIEWYNGDNELVSTDYKFASF